MRKSFLYLILFSSAFHLVSSSTLFGIDVKKCKKRDGLFPVPGSYCRSFYRCKGWRLIEEIACERNLHFDPYLEYCVRPENYPCFEKPVSKECPRKNGNFLKEGTKCKQYYSCCNGRPSLKSCPRDQVFDARREKCEWTELYTCPEVPDREKCPRANGKFLKVGTSCKEYYECRDGVPTEKSCPDDQIFDNERGTCEWSELGICPEDIDREKCPHANGKFLKVGTSCKEYYECNNGVPTEKSCPDDQIFDTQQESCEWSELAFCPEDFSSTKTSTLKTKPTAEITDSTTKEIESSTPITFSHKNTDTPTTNSGSTHFEESTTSEPSLTPTSTDVITTKEDITTETDPIFTPELSTVIITTYTDSSSTDSNEDTTPNPTSFSTIPDGSTTGINKITTQTVPEMSTISDMTSKDQDISTDETTTKIDIITETDPISTPELSTVIITTYTDSSSTDSNEDTTPNPTSFSTIPDGSTTAINKITTQTVSEISTISDMTSKDQDISTDEATTKIDIITETDQTSTSWTSEINTVRTTYTNYITANSSEDTTSKPSSLTTDEIITATNKITSETDPEMSTVSDMISKDEDTSETQSYSTEVTGSWTFTGDNEFTSKSGQPREITPTFKESSSTTFSTNTPFGSTEKDSSEEPNENKSTVTTTSDNDETATPGIFCPEPNGWFPHPTDKRKFVACVGGNPVVLSCPGKLIYVHEKRRCDYDKKKKL